MGVFDKIKNALFEEEYVEVEEKPKKAKKELFKKETAREKRQEEKPIAKRVVLPEKKEVKVKTLEEEELFDDDFDIQPKEVKSVPQEREVQRDFKIMDDSDFQVEKEVIYPDVEQPKIVKVIEREEVSYQKEEDHYYQERHKEKQPYGLEQGSVVPVIEYGGAYEKKEEKTYFKPSPIISPIYGILDKNYKKEDVVPKREVRLTSSYARENLSVDDVRKKAYGNLDDDLVSEIEDFHTKKQEESFEIANDDQDDANLLVDLSTDDEKPSVKEVTMGDALEYFQDLGLEYNVDYVDATKEKATGRRVKENYDETFEVECDNKDKKQEEKNIVNEEKNGPILKERQHREAKDVDIDSDDNLFDLIDSMYKEEY